MAVGIPLMGVSFSSAILQGIPDDGMITSPQELLGVYLQIYLGTLGIMLLGNSTSELVVLRLHHRVFLSTIISLLVGFIVAMGLCMYYLIEPQKTFSSDDDSISTNDPNRSASGCFFFVGFSYLAGICLGILYVQFNDRKRLEKAKVSCSTCKSCIISIPNDQGNRFAGVTAVPASDTTLIFRNKWGLSSKIKRHALLFFRKGNRQALGFIALCIFLG